MLIFIPTIFISLRSPLGLLIFRFTTALHLQEVGLPRVQKVNSWCQIFLIYVLDLCVGVGKIYSKEMYPDLPWRNAT